MYASTASTRKKNLVSLTLLDQVNYRQYSVFVYNEIVTSAVDGDFRSKSTQFSYFVLHQEFLYISCMHIIICLLKQKCITE